METEDALQEEGGDSSGFMTIYQLKVISVAQCVIVTIILCLTIYLLCYHSMLIRKNTTTYKYLRAQQRKSHVKSSVITEVVNVEDAAEGEKSVESSGGNANSDVQDSIQSLSHLDP